MGLQRPKPSRRRGAGRPGLARHDPSGPEVPAGRQAVLRAGEAARRPATSLGRAVPDAVLDEAKTD